MCPDDDDGGGDDCNDGLALAQNVEIVFLPTLRYHSVFVCIYVCVCICNSQILLYVKAICVYLYVLMGQ